VGSELKEVEAMKLKELHVAIPRGGLGTGVAMYIRFEDLMSPSHTVGSELKRDWDLGGRGGVAIPHGGLRTSNIGTIRPQETGHHPTRWA